MARLWASLRNRVALLLAVFTGRPERALGEPEAAPRPWLASYPDGVQWDVEIAPKPLTAILDEAVTAWPDNPCLDFLGKRYSYKEVGALVAKAAKGFQEMGVEKGTRVGLFLPNSAYYVICYHAILRAGGVVINFNPLYAEREIARQIEDSGLRIMVTLNLKALYPKIARRLEDSGLEKIVICSMSQALSLPKKTLFLLFKRGEQAEIPADEAHIPFDKLVKNDGLPRLVEIDPVLDIAVLQYTGGTTGTPKGAMLTHANLYCNAIQNRMWATSLRPGEEKVLAILPLFHVFGMTAVMNLSLMGGAEIILVPRFKLAEALGIIDKKKPTILFGVPTIYSAINEGKERDDHDLSSLRYCISGGAPLPLAIKTKFEAVTGCTLVEGYGLSEAAPVCTINPIDGLNKENSAGLPLPATLIEVVSLEDPDKLLPLGEAGEICVTGPQVMSGYWRHEAETREVLRNGRLHTGDVGYMDHDGYVYLIDRIKDLIISGGFNVYPRMVEEAIYLHPAVVECAVCGAPDRHRGEVVKAFVKLRNGDERLTSAELRAFLKDKLAPFEIPRKVEFIDDIPKTLIGKPLRRALVEQERKRLEARDSVQPVRAAQRQTETAAEAALNHSGGPAE